MTLLELPSELLTLIAGHLGAYLRSSVEYLLLSRKWYRAALPAFLFCLPLSTIYLSSNDLLRWPPPHTPLSDLIANQVERLSIRLIGHPSRHRAVYPWNTGGNSDEDTSDDEVPEDAMSREYWMHDGPAVARNLQAGMKSDVWRTEEQQLRSWSRNVNEKLVLLAVTLPKFQNLRDLSFEASSESDGRRGPLWDYLFASTVEKFIYAVPKGLKSLTLDICAPTVTVSEHDQTPAHLCSLIACRLQDFKHVRLRMRHICPDVFDRSNNTVDQPSNLVSLVIRLSLPCFAEASWDKHNGYINDNALRCPSVSEKLLPLQVPMISGGITYAKVMKLELMRVSYGTSHREGVTLNIADCLTEKILYGPLMLYSYQDTGRQWNSWEDNNEGLTGF